jgi:HEPN/Toprim N-terminal domain 1
VGTEITLDVAGLTLDFSKNFVGSDHGALFQRMDRKRICSEQIDYEYCEENEGDTAPMEMGFTRKLKDVLPRLEFLGFTIVNGGAIIDHKAPRERQLVAVEK